MLSLSAAAEPTYDQRKQALDLIANFADRFCKDIPLEATADSLELSGQAKAQLHGIVRKLAGLGIEGAGQYQSSEYQGLLQEDIVEGLRYSMDCRLQIWKDLKSTFLDDFQSAHPTRQRISQPGISNPLSADHASCQEKNDIRLCAVNCSSSRFPDWLTCSLQLTNLSPIAREIKITDIGATLRSTAITVRHGRSWGASLLDQWQPLNPSDVESLEISINIHGMRGKAVSTPQLQVTLLERESLKATKYEMALP